ncbi:Glycosyl transferase, group 1 family protein, partial [hydrothermal vent metagenome]
MKLAYFINQYPGISHSFIRREIQALERGGAEIFRYAIRPSKDEVIAQEDFDESDKTRHIITAGAGPIIRSIASEIVANPLGAARALGAAMSMGWRSEAGLVRHLFYFGEALVLANWLKRDGLRHVHAHFGTNAATIAMLAAPLARASFSFTVHGPEEFEKPALISLRRKLESAAFSVAISQFGASQLKKLSSP